MSTTRFVSAAWLTIGFAIQLGCNQESSVAPAEAPVQTTMAAQENSTASTHETASENTSTEAETTVESAGFAFYTVDHYDEARDPAQDLQAALVRAKAENKNVLVQVGGDWCGWCKLMTKFIESNEKVRGVIDKNFLLMKVTWTPNQKNEDFLSKYPEINGYPHLFVFDSSGELLHSQDTAALEEGKGYNEDVYVTFLSEWAPEP